LILYLRVELNLVGILRILIKFLCRRLLILQDLIQYLVNLMFVAINWIIRPLLILGPCDLYKFLGVHDLVI
jgi:hypothetical protein